MMQFLKRLLFRRKPVSTSKMIKTECDTLRRWADRASVGKQF